jgi:cytochrome c5
LRFDSQPSNLTERPTLSSQDQSFFNTFMVVIGVMVGIGVILIITARTVAGNTQLAWVQSDPAYAASVDERIAPVGRVSIAGEEAATTDTGTAAAAAAPAEVAKVLDGEQVYNTACMACHGSGAAGAPKFGDAGAWKARLAQGADTLHKHALEGFQGGAGFMPPKGGQTQLSDAEVIGAVDFMAAKSR